MEWIYFWLIIIGGLLACIGIVVGFLLWYKTYNYKLRVREISSGHRLIRDLRAKVKVDKKDKVAYLLLWSKLDGLKQLPLPPENTIDYDPSKKKKVVECYYTPEKGIIYITDKDSDLKGFEPFTTKQRIMMVNQLYKKEQRKTKGFKENIPLIVGGITLLLLVVCIMVFWGEFVKPMREMNAQNINFYKESLTKWEYITEKLDVIANGNRTQFITGNPPP